MPEIENQYVYNWKRAQQENRRARTRLQYRRERKYHPDNDLIKHKLEMAPCPCCGNLCVKSDMKSLRYTHKHWVKEYWAKCDRCAARGSWPVTGMPVDFIVTAIQKKMTLALVKELMAP